MNIKNRCSWNPLNNEITAVISFSSRNIYFETIFIVPVTLSGYSLLNNFKTLAIDFCS